MEGFEPSLKPMGEWDKRVLDLIHGRMTQEGMHTVYVPGNHDAYLRRPDLLHRRLMGMDYLPELYLQQTDDKQMLLFHGDELDGYNAKKFGRMIYRLGSMIGISEHFNLVSAFTHTQCARLSFMDSFQKARGKKTKSKFHRMAVELAHVKECDAVLTGHIHHPRPFYQSHPDYSIAFANAGGWVGDCKTAMILTQEGDWQLVNWDIRRFEMGCPDLPTKETFHPFAEYRAQTEAFLDVHKRLHQSWRSRTLLAALDSQEKGQPAEEEMLLQVGDEAETGLKPLLTKAPVGPYFLSEGRETGPHPDRRAVMTLGLRRVA